MKSVKQIRNDLEVLSESVESASEMRKLTTLVRAGLFDANKLTMLKRALNKENVKMTKAERETLLELLDKLLNLVTSNQQVFMKVKQSVSEEVEVLDGSEYQELDEALGGSANDINNLPPLIIMRRRAIRIFPDGQKVALYWADKINKFISVPFESIGISEETQLDEISVQKAQDVYAQRMAQKSLSDDDKAVSDYKAAQTLKRIKRRYGKVAQVRAIAMGKTAEKKATDNTISNQAAKISSAAGGGLTGAGAAVAGLTGAAINAGVKSALKRANKSLTKAMVKEDFKSKISDKRNLQEASAADVADIGAEILIPYYGAGKKLKSGDYKGAAIDAAIDTALIGAGALTGGAGYLAGKTAKAGVKGAKLLNKAKKVEPIVAKKGLSQTDDFTKAMEKTASKADDVKPPVKPKEPKKPRTPEEKLANQEKLKKQFGVPGRKRGVAARAAKTAATGAAIAGATLAGLGALGGSSGSSGQSSGSGQGKYGVARGTTNYNPFSTYRERKFAQSTIAQEQLAPTPQRNPFRSYRNRKMAISMAENSLFDKLKTISESKENYTHMFEDGDVEVTPALASKLLETYSKLNVKNKSSIQEMINKDKNSFIKVANFSAGK